MNETTKHLVWAISLIASVAVVGCSDGGTSADAGGADDLADPGISINNVDLFQAIAGMFDVEVTATDDVAVQQVDLMIDGAVAATSTEAPFTIPWDTTIASDGIVSISALVTDTAGKTAETEAIDVVLINTGEEVTFIEGNTGTISIPDPVSGDNHVKHHWTTSVNGAAEALVILQFEAIDADGEWELIIDVGTGGCPHSGVTFATSGTLTVSPIVFEPDLSSALPADTGCFVHMGVNESDHAGHDLDYEVRVFNFF